MYLHAERWDSSPSCYSCVYGRPQSTFGKPHPEGWNGLQAALSTASRKKLFLSTLYSFRFSPFYEVVTIYIPFIVVETEIEIKECAQGQVSVLISRDIWGTSVGTSVSQPWEFCGHSRPLISAFLVPISNVAAQPASAARSLWGSYMPRELTAGLLSPRFLPE